MAVPAVVESFSQLFIIRCTTIAAVTIAIWDYCLTFGGEVDLIWTATWNASKVLFMLNRYLAFVDPIMLLYVLIFSGGDVKSCRVLFQTLVYIAVVGFAIAQCILMLRAYAVWGRRYAKYFSVFFGVFLCALAVAFWLNSMYLRGLTSLGKPAANMNGCELRFSDRTIWIELVLFVFFESVSTLLLVIKAVQDCRDTQASLMTIIYRDGLLYYICILATTVVNITIILVAPVQPNSILLMIQRVLHSVLCNRVLLHIREAYFSQFFQRMDLENLSTMVAELPPTERTMDSHQPERLESEQ